MTRKEFKEKTFRVAMDLHCIGMLLPEKALKDCKEYFDRLNDNIGILINELDKYIPEGEEK